MNHKEMRMVARSRPKTFALNAFPLISQITGGVSGVWVIGAETGGSKTTFARHIAYSVVGPDLRVAYLDTEGHWLRDDVTEQILSQHRPEVADLADDYMLVFQDSGKFRAHVDALPVRTLIVVDHVQIEAERNADGADSFRNISTVMATAVDWSNQGHLVLVLSQVNRASYGTKAPTKAIFKGNSAIEDAATIGAALWRPDKGHDNLIQFRVVKTRFVPMPSEAVNIVRDGWSLREVGLVPVDEEREARSPRRRKHRYEIVLDRAFRFDDALTNTALAKAFGMSTRTGQTRIKQCIAMGFIVRDEDGLYRRTSEREPKASASETDRISR